MVVVRIQPALDLEAQTDSEIGQYTTNRVADLVLHEDKFPDLKPTPEELTQKNVDFSKALGSLEADRTLKKNRIRRELEIMLIACASNCAEICDNNLEIYKLTRFGYKRKSEPAGALPAPENLSVEIGPGEGQLYVKFKGVKNNHGYQIWFGKSGVSPDQWTEIMGVSSGRRTLLNDLESNVSYGVRVRAIGANKTFGAWTTVIIKKTY